jgi:hypothetical protein
MFNTFSKLAQLPLLLTFFLLASAGLTACDSEPPELMKATEQFDSDETRDQHIAFMRKNHMDALIHKRDQTMYEGIRTKKNSIKACINCHVPAEYEGKPLRHTNSKHFCSTCHGFVAAQLDCFECHTDQPQVTQMSSLPQDEIHHKVAQIEKQNVNNQTAEGTAQTAVKGESTSE